MKFDRVKFGSAVAFFTASVKKSAYEDGLGVKKRIFTRAELSA